MINKVNPCLIDDRHAQKILKANPSLKLLAKNPSRQNLYEKSLM